MNNYSYFFNNIYPHLDRKKQKECLKEFKKEVKAYNKEIKINEKEGKKSVK